MHYVEKHKIEEEEDMQMSQENHKIGNNRTVKILSCFT